MENSSSRIFSISHSGEDLLRCMLRNSAVLVSEDDWRAIKETIYLLGIPGMRESIIKVPDPR